MTRQQDLEELFAVVDKLRDSTPHERDIIPSDPGVYILSNFRKCPERASLAVLDRGYWKLGGAPISREGLRHWLEARNIALVKLEVVG